MARDKRMMNYRNVGNQAKKKKKIIIFRIDYVNRL